MNRQQHLPTPDNKTDWFRVEAKAKDKPAKVYVYDAIGGWFGIEVNEFIKQLNEIENDEIHLHINSPGGSVFDGIAIYNSLKQHDAKITAYVDGIAASAASFIAQAGEKVIMARNATMMIHDAIGSCYGNRADMIAMADMLDKVSDNIADIYAFNAGGTVAEWREFMKAETWYSAAEAVEAGLANEMLDADDDDDSEDAENKWDLSMFNYAGRDKAPSPFDIREQVKNQLKEASMGTAAPKNTEAGTEETPPAAAPAVAPEETPPAEAAPETPETDPEGTEPTNKVSFSVLINGVATSNVQTIQNHIRSLETFRSETIDQSRRNFVTGLSDSNKIASTQVDSLIEVALEMSDTQYEKWKASYDAAPALGLFGNHGVTPGDESRPGTGSVSDVANEIATLEAIVLSHKQSGMPQAQIESKDSWKRLQDLKSTKPTQ